MSAFMTSKSRHDVDDDDVAVYNDCDDVTRGGVSVQDTAKISKLEN